MNKRDFQLQLERLVGEYADTVYRATRLSTISALLSSDHRASEAAFLAVDEVRVESRAKMNAARDALLAFVNGNFKEEP